MLSSKSLAFLFQRIIPPTYHSLVWQRFGLDHVERCFVKWRKVDKEEVLVSSLIERLYTFCKHGGNDGFVEVRKRYFEFACIADVVDSDPDSNQGILLRAFKDFSKLGLYPGQELLCLIDERYGPVMM